MRFFFAICFVGCALLWAGEPWALSVKKPTFALLTKKSVHVLKATVIGTRPQVGGKGLPFTWTDFRVSHVYKGTKIKQISLRLVGASVGKYRLILPGVPRFRVGQEVVLCVRHYAHAVSPVLVALSYGVFDLTKTPKGLVVRNRGGLSVPADWTSFEQLLRRTIAAQAPYVKTPMTRPKAPTRQAPVPRRAAPQTR